MECIQIEGLRKEGTDDLEGHDTARIDLPATSKLANIPPLLSGFAVPEYFARIRPDGTDGRKFAPKGIYHLRYPSERLEVSTDRASSFSERCINIDDTLAHFASLHTGTRELTATLEHNRSGPATAHSEKIIVDDRLELTFHRTLRMPDDGKTHPLPDSCGTFPLYNVEAFASQLPEHVTKRGGVFFPMWQREALWIKFENRNSDTTYAVRINIGHINVVSGLDIYQVTEEQDYVVVPGQMWLDGITVDPGVVRQFVAMPLGSGYTVEGQVSGKEQFGGIQIEVIPSYDRYRHSFRCRNRNKGSLSMLDHCSPRDYRLKNGDIVTMGPIPSEFPGLPRLCDFLDDEEGFDEIEELHVKAIYRQALERRHSIDMASEGLGTEYPEERTARYDPIYSAESPFVERRPGTRSARSASTYTNKLGATYSERGFARGPPLCDFPEPRPSYSTPFESQERTVLDVKRRGKACRRLSSDRNTSHTNPSPNTLQEMGIAAGGRLIQDIVRDTLPKGIWNTAKAKLINIHIFHPPDFEAITHIVPPSTPISAQEYIAAGIPFYALEEDPEQRLDGSSVLNEVKSVSAMDQHVGVLDGSGTEFNPLKPRSCGACAIRLCDCIVRPCNHQFCHVCVKMVASSSKSMASGPEQRLCPLCSTSISRVAGFSAPMNLPGEETFKVDVSVVMYEAQDGRAAFESVVKMRL